MDSKEGKKDLACGAAQGTPERLSLDHTDTWMLDFSLEDECQTVAVNSPHQRPDAEGRPFRRHQLELDDGSCLQPCLGPDSRTMSADVQRHPEVPVGPHLNEHRPRHTGSWVMPSILLSRLWHEDESGSVTALTPN